MSGEPQGTGFGIEVHWETFVFWPALAVMRSVGSCECEDESVAAPLDDEPFGWSVVLSFLTFTVSYSWEDAS